MDNTSKFSGNYITFSTHNKNKESEKHIVQRIVNHRSGMQFLMGRSTWCNIREYPVCQDDNLIICSIVTFQFECHKQRNPALTLRLRKFHLPIFTLPLSGVRRIGLQYEGGKMSKMYKTKLAQKAANGPV